MIRRGRARPIGTPAAQRRGQGGRQREPVKTSGMVRTLKQKALATAQAGARAESGAGRRARSSEWEGASRQLALVILWLLLGLVMPRAGV